MTARKTRELNNNEKLSVFNANVIIIIIIIRYIILGILIISIHNQDCLVDCLELQKFCCVNLARASGFLRARW